MGGDLANRLALVNHEWIIIKIKVAVEATKPIGLFLKQLNYQVEF